MVYGDARVSGNARVSGDAWVSSNEHLFVASPIGEYEKSVTLFRRKNLEIGVSYYGTFFSISRFEEYIDRWDEKTKKVAKATIEIAKLHIDLSQKKNEFKSCPFCGGEGIRKDNVVCCSKCNATTPASFWNNRVDTKE